MNRDKLVEKVARAIADYELPVGPGWQDRWRDYLGTADAAVDIALEEAARVAETVTFPPEAGMSVTEVAIIRGGKKAAENIAAAIRAMKSSA